MPQHCAFLYLRESQDEELFWYAASVLEVPLPASKSAGPNVYFDDGGAEKSGRLTPFRWFTQAVCALVARPVPLSYHSNFVRKAETSQQSPAQGAGRYQDTDCHAAPAHAQAQHHCHRHQRRTCGRTLLHVRLTLLRPFPCTALGDPSIRRAPPNLLSYLRCVQAGDSHVVVFHIHQRRPTDGHKGNCGGSTGGRQILGKT